MYLLCRENCERTHVKLQCVPVKYTVTKHPSSPRSILADTSVEIDITLDIGVLAVYNQTKMFRLHSSATHFTSFDKKIIHLLRHLKSRVLNSLNFKSLLV